MLSGADLTAGSTWQITTTRHVDDAQKSGEDLLLIAPGLESVPIPDVQRSLLVMEERVIHLTPCYMETRKASLSLLFRRALLRPRRVGIPLSSASHDPFSWCQPGDEALRP